MFAIPGHDDSNRLVRAVRQKTPLPPASQSKYGRTTDFFAPSTTSRERAKRCDDDDISSHRRDTTRMTAAHEGTKRNLCDRFRQRTGAHRGGRAPKTTWEQFRRNNAFWSRMAQQKRIGAAWRKWRSTSTPAIVLVCRAAHLHMVSRGLLREGKPGHKE